MALANVAELLYKKDLNVLMIDWDLEAPGLERYFPTLDNKDILAKRGVIDMINEYKRQIAEPLNLIGAPSLRNLPFLSPIELAIDVYGDQNKSGGRLRILTAGYRADSFSQYAAAVNGFDWTDFYEHWYGELYFEWLREHLVEFDVVLIDSRTGIAEMSGVCTYQLADLVLLLCAPNQQNIDGSLQMARNFTRPEVRNARNNRLLRVGIIPARIEDRAEEQLRSAFRAQFTKVFDTEFLSENLKQTLNSFWDLRIPYVPYYAFNETVAVRDISDVVSDDLIIAFRRIARIISWLAPSDTRLQKSYSSESRDNTITILQPLPTSQVPYLPSPPAFQVPYPSALLIGRSADLDALAELLLAEQPVALTPAIAGMGGVGKTMLAATFARQHQADFPGGIFWLNMEQPDSIASQVAACAGPGGLDLAGYEQLSFAERILRTKASWNGSERRLLVFDNLEDPALLKQWQPTGSGSRVLITTRRDDWPRLVRRLRLSVLPRPQSIELLLGARAEDLGRTIAQLLSNPDDQREADTICELLGDLPLALAIAAAFLRLSPSTTLRRYREQIEANPLASEYQLDETMREIIEEAGLPTGRERGIIATFAFSYQHLNPDDPTDALALTVLHAAAYCAPAPIPQAVLWRVGNVASDEVEIRTRRDAAIRRLRAIGLLVLESEGEPPPVSVHRLIAAYLRSLLNDADIQRRLGVALTNAGNAAVNSGYPSQSAPLVAHFLHVVAQLHEDDAASGALYGALARVHQQQSNYAEALPLYQRALAIWEATLGSQHPDTATSLNNLAGLYESTGNYDAALPLYQRALAIRETALGSQHPDTATSLNNLAGLYESTGNYEAALPLYQRALAIWEATLGPQHPDTATSLNNLAGLYRATGNYAAALPLLERALTIWEATLGPQHPDTATSLNNLTGLYRATGNYEAALPLYQRALAIRETALGPQHPDTATSLNNLAGLYESTGNYAEALPLYQRALAIWEATLGPQHPDTATSLNNLAGLYKSTGNYDAALPLFQRALAIRETALGPQHPDTATSLNNLAELYRVTGNYAEALPLCQRALAISEATLGPQHPTTATSLNNLAVFYADQGDFDQAIRFIERALLIRERTLGAQHPDTQQTRQSLQNMLVAQIPASFREALQRNYGASFRHALQQFDAAKQTGAIITQILEGVSKR